MIRVVSVIMEDVSFGNVEQIFQEGTNMVIGVNTQGRIIRFIATDIFGRSVSVLVSCDAKEVIGLRWLLS